MKTVQIKRDGRWHNIHGHGCADEVEMQEYVVVLSRYGPSLRVADEDTDGENADAN